MWTHTRGLIIVDIYSFQLKIRVSVVMTGRIDAVFVTNHFPKLITNKEKVVELILSIIEKRLKFETKWTYFGSDLIPALSGLNVHYFTHFHSKQLVINKSINI